jgi:hypothetical protein
MDDYLRAGFVEWGEPTNSFDDAEDRRRTIAYQHAWEALRQTPEQQYLDEVKAEEAKAFHDIVDRAGSRLPRGTAFLYFSDDDDEKFLDVGKAIDDGEGFASSVADKPIDSLVSVAADMRRMTAAQVARVLRKFADDMEENGIPVHLGQHPHPVDGEACEWWVMERPNGELKHDIRTLAWLRRSAEIMRHRDERRRHD